MHSSSKMDIILEVNEPIKNKSKRLHYVLTTRQCARGCNLYCLNWRSALSTGPFHTAQPIPGNKFSGNSRFFLPHQQRGYARSFHLKPSSNPRSTKNRGVFSFNPTPEQGWTFPGKKAISGNFVCSVKDRTNIPRQCPGNSPGNCVVWKPLVTSRCL